MRSAAGHIRLRRRVPGELAALVLGLFALRCTTKLVDGGRGNRRSNLDSKHSGICIHSKEEG